MLLFSSGRFKLYLSIVFNIGFVRKLLKRRGHNWKRMLTLRTLLTNQHQAFNNTVGWTAMKTQQSGRQPSQATNQGTLISRSAGYNFLITTPASADASLITLTLKIQPLALLINRLPFPSSPPLLSRPLFLFLPRRRTCNHRRYQSQRAQPRARDPSYLRRRKWFMLSWLCLIMTTQTPTAGPQHLPSHAFDLDNVRMSFIHLLVLRVGKRDHSKCGTRCFAHLLNMSHGCGSNKDKYRYRHIDMLTAMETQSLIHSNNPL